MKPRIVDEGDLLMPGLKECVWVYRPGTDGSHWAYTPCQPGFNYLSKIARSEPLVGVADAYVGRICPICGGKIRMDYVTIKENWIREKPRFSGVVQSPQKTGFFFLSIVLIAQNAGRWENYTTYILGLKFYINDGDYGHGPQSIIELG